MTGMSRFQSFDESADPSQGPARLTALRTELKRQGLDGFIVPRADEFQSEYVPPCAERLAWLSGFTGSAGTIVVLMDKAALVVDGRYTLQAREQVDTDAFTPVALAETPPEAWIEQNLPQGAAFGFDPWLTTGPQREKLEKAVTAAGGHLVAVAANPLDAVWTDRPAAPAAPVSLHAHGGESTSDKLARVRDALTKARCDGLVISDPHNLMWLFNVRGSDVAHTPLALGYGLIPREGKPAVFLDPDRFKTTAREALAGIVALSPAADFRATLSAFAKGKRLRLDKATASSALADLIKEAGGETDLGDDPIALMKARKNVAEIEGSRAAHLRDGAALTRFLAWFAREAPAGRMTEIDAALKLEEFRAATNALIDLSFPTISAFGPNAASPHYRVTTRTNRRIEPGNLFLIDSGAQYRDGTTDITRTIAVGRPTDEMRERNTRVLKGHIAIATALFPKGTSGAQIDAFARRPLWEAGLDFDHGTGHGVGAFLSVHEGPQRISKLGHVALEPGMILSNEPGFYKAGEYGIRIENMILVTEREVPGGDRAMLGFETLSFAPIDQALIAPDMLSADEVRWLDAYHAKVLQVIGPLVDDETRDWLKAATRPLEG